MSTQVIINSNSSPLLVTRPKKRALVVVGKQGPAGPAQSTILGTAGEDLGGHRAVVFNASGQAVYADQTETDHAGRIAGVTTGAATSGSAVTIQRTGEMTEPGWSWNPESPLYLGTDGMLTETPPTSGVLQSIGHAVTATKILLDFSLYIVRG